jgi:hypothetical protein
LPCIKRLFLGGEHSGVIFFLGVWDLVDELFFSLIALVDLVL